MLIDEEVLPDDGYLDIFGHEKDPEPRCRTVVNSSSSG